MNQKTTDLLKMSLKQNGHSITKARLEIFNLFVGNEPQSVSELTKRGHGKFDRASLYRTIRLFEEAGIIHRINIGWKYKLELADNFTVHHHHLTCLNCGRVIPVEHNKTLETLIVNVANENDFSAVDHQLEVQGYCTECQNKV